MASRSYGDPCGVARALDVVGERWALLVVRELLLGPKRFRDLAQDLGGISQNVLSQRLRELEHAGVVQRGRAGYELTARGAALEPVLIALGRWGRERAAPAGELTADALLLALKTAWDPARAPAGRTTLELRVDGERYSAVAEGGRLEVARGPARDPDAVVSATVAELREAAFRAGPLAVAGDEAAARRLFAATRA